MARYVSVPTDREMRRAETKPITDAHLASMHFLLELVEDLAPTIKDADTRAEIRAHLGKLRELHAFLHRCRSAAALALNSGQAPH